MVTGIVLVRLKPGKEKSALLKIKDIKGVSHVSAIFGRWDAVVDIDTGDISTLTGVVVGKIRSIDGVVSTETLITTAI